MNNRQTNTNTLTKMRTIDLTLIPLFSALIAVGAFIKVPIGIVPVSAQFVFCALAGILLGARKGFMAVGLYLLIGLSGIPVFTGGGGPQYVFYPTFGYLVGMLFGTTLIGYLTQKFGGGKILPVFLFCLLGLTVVYTLGVIWLFLIKNSFMAASNLSLNDAIVKGALIFLIGDSLWCGVASVIGTRINRIMSGRYLK